eukprot:403368041
MAVKKNNEQIVQALIDIRYPLNIQKNNGVTAVGIASYTGNVKILDMLYRVGADINFLSQKGINPLYIAIKQNKIEVVKYLVERKANIHLRYPQLEEYSPIFYAIRQGNLKVIEIMCDSGLDFETIKNNEGYDPIHFAAVIDQDDIVNYLSLRKKYLDTEDMNGYTLLTKYLLKENLDLAQKMLQRSASINYQNKDHQSSLIICLRNSKERAVRFLLERGAELHLRDTQGLDACDHAQRNVNFKDWPEFNRCKNKFDKQPLSGQPTIEHSIARNKEFQVVKPQLEELKIERLPIDDPINPIKIDPLSKIQITNLQTILDREENANKRFHINDLIGVKESYSSKMMTNLNQYDQDKRKLDLEKLNNDYYIERDHFQDYSQDFQIPRDSPSNQRNLVQSIDSHVFIREEKLNDLKMRRSRERDQVKYENDKRKLEMLKSLNVGSNPLDHKIKIVQAFEQPKNNVYDELLNQKESVLELESKRLDQQIQDKMREQELKLKNIRESSNNIQLQAFPSLSQLSQKHSNNLESVRQSSFNRLRDIDPLQSMNKQSLKTIKGIDTIKETLELQKKLLESKERSSRLEQERMRERREIDSMRNRELSKFSTLHEKAAGNLNKLRSDLEGELRKTQKNQNHNTSLLDEIKNLPLEMQNNSQLPKIRINPREDVSDINERQKIQDMLPQLQSRNHDSQNTRNSQGFRNPILSSLAQRMLHGNSDNFQDKSQRDNLHRNMHLHNNHEDQQLNQILSLKESISRLKNQSNFTTTNNRHYTIDHSNHLTQQNQRANLDYSFNQNQDDSLINNQTRNNNSFVYGSNNFGQVRAPKTIRNRSVLNQFNLLTSSSNQNTNYDEKEMYSYMLNPKLRENDQQDLQNQQKKKYNTNKSNPNLSLKLQKLNIESSQSLQPPTNQSQDLLSQIQDKISIINSQVEIKINNKNQVGSQVNQSKQLERHVPNIKQVYSVQRVSRKKGPEIQLMPSLMRTAVANRENRNLSKDQLDNRSLRGGKSKSLRVPKPPLIAPTGEFLLQTDMRAKMCDKPCCSNSNSPTAHKHKHHHGLAHVHSKSVVKQ